MLSLQNIPIFFYVIVTRDKKILFVKYEGRWALPCLKGRANQSHDQWLYHQLRPLLSRIELHKKEVLYNEPKFWAGDGNTYDCHLIAFAADHLEARDDRRDDVWIASPDMLINDTAHDSIRGLLDLPELQSRLR